MADPDLTLAELSIEAFLPADTPTAHALRARHEASLRTARDGPADPR